MSDFQRELVKILFDKVLLGLLAASFGFYLSRLLEDHRTRNAHRLAVFQQRLEACKTLVSVVSEHHRHVIGLLEMILRVAEKNREGKKYTPEDEKIGLAYIENNERLVSQLGPFLPLISYDMADALIAYMKETTYVSDIVKGIIPPKLPSREDLDASFMKFAMSYQTSLFKDDLFIHGEKGEARVDAT